ncbi:uncharacterized protein EV420DRAFT_1649104 [Desarmillaria tabescens]|uniref:Uncharacterized protein n=1 Tax=Armillaria tabescens TaxID=1929756 RepID=A0AA39JK78_ARMTA|nr:uncharacterized protein EV420DRAFT_1649104 [Desarmillaria tabescens]KAK0443999.1 hypothetical protein EV420DRAFT_1649104 [Desarmillaria tabescens]
MSAAFSQSVSPVAMITQAATTIEKTLDMPSVSPLPMATTRPNPGAYVQPTIIQCHDPVARSLATVAVFFAIGMLILTTLLVLKIQKLKVRVGRWESAGDDHEVLFSTPSDASMYGDENKALLGGVVEPALAEGAQAGSAVPH